MLPKSTEELGMASHSIYINPNFNKFKAAKTNTHINPNFLRPRASTAIHLNPQFLQGKLIEQQRLAQELQLLNQQQQQPAISTMPPSLAIIPEPELPNSANPLYIPGPSCKLISKSSMRIVREPISQHSEPTIATSTPKSPMIKLGRCKLLRSTLLKDVTRIATEAKASAKSVRPVGAADKYKIDRRRGSAISSISPHQRIRRRAFVAQFALRRSSDFSTKRNLSSSGSRKVSFKIPAVPSNKKLQLLNINGVLYKSTRNKLQRKESTISSSAACSSKPRANILTPKSSCGRTLIVRGTRFVMDKQGYKLTRLADAAYATPSLAVRPNSFRRIDIGGLTYVATSHNTFVRTGNHLARSHVNNAKQKSVQLLTRNLAKSNIPCAIFQRVGKCAAFDRGKCRKVHDPRQVTICSKFLRGNCSNTNCLLSHNVSLTKMPVCKFFLQGLCVRADCPYLHKKVGKHTEICNEFLRGYCKLAEQCDKRHEFLCPDYERNGICVRTNCAYCKKKRQVHKEPKPTLPELPSIANVVEPETVSNPKRYFIGESEIEKCPQATEENLNNSIVESDDELTTASSSKPSRPKLGILPAYIPLS